MGRMERRLSPQAKEFWSLVRANPHFSEVMKEVKSRRPVVPAYKACQTQEEQFSIMERIRFESGRQEGFDLIYLLLTGDRNE